MEPKYTLKDTTKEEQDLFMQDFNDLLNKHSMYFEPVPQYVRDDLQSPWKITYGIFLQKKTLVEEPTVTEVIKNNEPVEATE